MQAIEITHNFESAHRLPILGGKCVSLHGHSFLATVTIEADSADADGIVAEYADAKAHFRHWIDTNWDHGVILGGTDPLVPVLRMHDTKVAALASGHWPTVETLAAILAGVMEEWCHHANRSLDRGERPTVHVRRVHLRETAVNAAVWSGEAAL
jgi:6-pyruvoyltetrahydropterin/6-carboxytetrahydropterin synthase